MKELILIDAKNCAYRAHYTHMYLSSRKRPTSVIYGMTSMLLSIKNKLQLPIVVVWDGKGSTWRHQLTKGRKKEYKGNRGHVDVRSVVNSQVDVLQQFLSDIGVVNLEVPNLEADDLIGILAKTLTKDFNYEKVIIYSGDRDYFQLLDDKISIFSTQGRKKGFILTPKHVEKQFGVPVKDYTKVRAFSGDKSDNISNVIKGIGGKTAVKLVKDGLDPSLKEIVDHKLPITRKYEDKFGPIWKMVHENYQLCRIITNEKDKHLTLDQREKINDILYFFTRELKSEKSEGSHRKMIDFLINYELDDLFDRRKELFSLGNFPD